MKENPNIILVVLFSVALLILGIGYLSNYIGWNGYRKWEHRVATDSKEESEKRGVFIKELSFKIDSFSGDPFEFKPYIEKGFRFSKKSSEETIPITGSQFPFQLSFNSRPTKQLNILIRDDQLTKFDSSDASWGYLKEPALHDTIILIIGGENIKSGIIKVWDGK